MAPRTPRRTARVASEQRFRRLYAAMGEINRSLDLDHRLRATVRAARELESADAAALMLCDAGQDVLVIRAHEGLSQMYADRQRVPLSEARTAYGGPDAHRIADLRTNALGDRELIRAEGLASVLAVPLAFDGELLGSLHIYSKDRARSFDAEDIEIAHVLAAAAATGITDSRLYAEAIDQRERLRRSDEEREQFLSIVSHELRTPLTPLKALAQLLRSRMRRAREEGGELDLDSFDHNLAAIERQVDRMNGLVNDLLSVSRAERGKLHMERVSFDLAAVAREVVLRYVAATAEEGRHRFTVSAPASLPVQGDQTRIEQLLMNLVGNAVKYSPAGGEVRVTLMADGTAAEIAIADAGIGIPPEELTRLGHAFVRGGGRAETFTGMGIGLYVARLVAEAHGGSLRIASDGDSKGTTVHVRLPG